MHLSPCGPAPQPVFCVMVFCTQMHHQGPSLHRRCFDARPRARRTRTRHDHSHILLYPGLAPLVHYLGPSLHRSCFDARPRARRTQPGMCTAACGTYARCISPAYMHRRCIQATHCTADALRACLVLSAYCIRTQLVGFAPPMHHQSPSLHRRCFDARPRARRTQTRHAHSHSLLFHGFALVHHLGPALHHTCFDARPPTSCMLHSSRQTALWRQFPALLDIQLCAGSNSQVDLLHAESGRYEAQACKQHGARRCHTRPSSPAGQALTVLVPSYPTDRS